ncbi:uncharacterized protein LOC125691963 [Lagopus muta]|uniref:uncharacterized protein LOC125691963 n=1 Tax=Lagopus muta TaxID=64668 RepID=UPI00209CCC97|nr:uncharacterized protein LOC125691963 [Lagopus muta]
MFIKDSVPEKQGGFILGRMVRMQSGLLQQGSMEAREQLRHQRNYAVCECRGAEGPGERGERGAPSGWSRKPGVGRRTRLLRSGARRWAVRRRASFAAPIARSSWRHGVDESGSTASTVVGVQGPGARSLRLLRWPLGGPVSLSRLCDLQVAVQSTTSRKATSPALAELVEEPRGTGPSRERPAAALKESPSTVTGVPPHQRRSASGWTRLSKDCLLFSYCFCSRGASPMPLGREIPQTQPAVWKRLAAAALPVLVPLSLSKWPVAHKAITVALPEGEAAI